MPWSAVGGACGGESDRARLPAVICPVHRRLPTPPAPCGARAGLSAASPSPFPPPPSSTMARKTVSRKRKAAAAAAAGPGGLHGEQVGRGWAAGCVRGGESLVLGGAIRAGSAWVGWPWPGLPCPCARPGRGNKTAGSQCLGTEWGEAGEQSRPCSLRRCRRDSLGFLPRPTRRCPSWVQPLGP